MLATMLRLRLLCVAEPEFAQRAAVVTTLAVTILALARRLRERLSESVRFVLLVIERLLMKYLVLYSVLFFGAFVNAQEPTPAESPEPQSVLAQQPAPQPVVQKTTVEEAVPAETVPNVNVLPPAAAVVVEHSTCDVVDVVYKGKRNIAPNAVNKTVVICFCESSCENCKLVSSRKQVPVDICVPPCPCKETVSSHRGGRRVVYDFGKYEVVLLARRDGTVEVDYKKRLLDR